MNYGRAGGGRWVSCDLWALLPPSRPHRKKKLLQYGAVADVPRSTGASPLSSTRERSLLAATGAGDRDATEELVTAFLPAIDGVASLYRSFASLERRELRQEGVVGLLRAARRYDQSYDTPFWAYASWWVRQAMQQLVAELTSPVVLSDRAARNLVRVKRARSAYVQANRREPSDGELAEAASMPLDQVQNLISIERAPSSLQERLPGDEQMATTFAERLADPATEEAYERVVDLVEAEHIQDLAAGLDERERRIVFAHYGIGCAQRTLREIGEEFALSVERIRQLEERALGKLRQAAAWPPGAAGRSRPV
jgi:RNA polymerase sigma factor (sigma-70 family)